MRRFFPTGSLVTSISCAVTRTWSTGPIPLSRGVSTSPARGRCRMTRSSTSAPRPPASSGSTLRTPAAEQILSHRDADQIVVGHADWYAGNTAVADGELVGTFDWELVADTEAVIAGFTAACYASSATSGGGLSTPEEVAAFMIDYDSVRGNPFSAREQRTAAGAAAWILAFNARWHVALMDLGHGHHATVNLVRDRHEDYLSLRW